jgi:hypothetical protein
VVRLLKRRGIRVRLVPLSAGEYFLWLLRHNLTNTPANRARFVGARAFPIAPEPLPDTLEDN